MSAPGPKEMKARREAASGFASVDAEIAAAKRAFAARRYLSAIERVCAGYAAFLGVAARLGMADKMLSAANAAAEGALRAGPAGYPDGDASVRLLGWTAREIKTAYQGALDGVVGERGRLLRALHAHHPEGYTPCRECLRHLRGEKGDKSCA